MSIFHPECVYITVVTPDRLLIPCFNVAKCNLNQVDDCTIANWKKLISRWQSQFETLGQSIDMLTKTGYKIVYADNYSLPLPSRWQGGFVSNFFDFFDASSEQIFEFIELTNISLDSIRIKNFDREHVCNYAPTMHTFINLSFANSQRLANIAIKEQSSQRICMCILAWWAYGKDDKSTNGEMLEFARQSLYLKSKTRCDYYIMLVTRAQQLENTEMLKWLFNWTEQIVWDQDLLSDLPNFCFEDEILAFVYNDFILQERKSRGFV